MNTRWVTPKQLEEMFGIKQQTQAKKRIRGELPYSKLGGFVYYDIEKINTLLENHAVVS